MKEYVFKTDFPRIDSTNAFDFQDEMEEGIEDFYAEDADMFVVDMMKTTYLSSAGLRILASAYKKIKANGKNFIMRNVSEGLRDLFDVTGLSGYLPME